MAETGHSRDGVGAPRTAEASVEFGDTSDQSGAAEEHGLDARKLRTVALTVIAMDPSVTHRDGSILITKVAVTADRLEPGPRSHRFHVVDYDTTTRTANPPADLRPTVGGDGWRWRDLAKGLERYQLETDPAFRAQNVWAIATRTLDTFEQALGRRLPWSFTGHHLYLVPGAFAEPNAYYASEDRAVLFGYVPRGGGKPPVHTALAFDVVAHEVTHAILDGLRPRLAEPGLPDQLAFHEGFADIVALLSVLSSEEVIQSVLGAPDDQGRIADAGVEPEVLKEEALFGAAKQLGATLEGDRSKALRRSVELEPTTTWRDDPSYDEPHRRGEILVAAVTQTMLGMWVNRLQALRHGGGLDRDRAAEEGAKAARHLLAMCLRAIDYSPPVEFEFADFVDAVLVADEVVAPDDQHDYRSALKDSFRVFGIEPPPRMEAIIDFDKEGAKPLYDKLNFDALRVDADEIDRFIWQNAGFLGLDLDFHLHVERVRHATRVGPDGLVVSEILADYIQSVSATLAHFEKLGVRLPKGIDKSTAVQMWGGGVIVFDQFGRAKFHQRKLLQEWQGRQSDRLEYLVSHGLADSHHRFGFSYGERRGQRFSALHASSSTEAW
jgi:hypothetical protein